MKHNDNKDNGNPSKDKPDNPEKPSPQEKSVSIVCYAFRVYGVFR